MKVILKIAALLITISTVTPQKVMATHAYGGAITYKSVGNDSFLITVKFYRDCNGVQFGTSSVLKASCGSTSLNVAYSVVSPVDVTPVCNSSCTKCQSLNCTFPYGVQEHVVVGTVYLGNYPNCCNWLIEWNQCCRSSTISTGSADQGFHVTSTLNSCLSTPNSSPKPVKPSFEMICLGSCTEINFGMADDDGDSLVYSLVSPLKSATQNIDYSLNYDYNIPLYFSGFPNANLNWNPIQCRGFHLDPKTGILRFRPMASQISVMAIKVEEYRNGNKIGEVVNDIGLIVTNCSGNQPEMNLPNNVSACGSDSLNINFSTYDKDTNQLTVSFFTKPPGAIITFDTSTLFPSGSIQYVIPDYESDKDTELVFVMKVQDNGCPVELSRNYIMRVIVGKRPRAAFTATTNYCGQVLFNAFPVDGDTSYTFHWTGTGGLDTVTKSFLHSYPSNGKYYFDLKVKEGNCIQDFSDSIEIYIDRDVISSGLPTDTAICYGETVTIAPKTGNPPYNVLILNDSSYSNLLSTPSDTTFIVEVTDAYGCTKIDTVNITVVPPVTVSAGQDRHFCENAGLQTFSGIPSGGVFSGKSMTDSNTFDPSLAGNDVETIDYTYTDSNGCSYSDSFYVQVNDRPLIALPNDTTICAGDQLSLDASPQSGSWSGNGLVNNYFDAATAGVGSHTLTYSYYVTPTCGNTDSFTVTVAPLPIVSAGTDTAICVNANITLLVSPAGGTWNLPAFQNDTFAALRAGSGLHTAVYSFTDSLGCANTDTVKIFVNFLQGVSSMADFNICANEATALLTANPTGGTWHGAGISGSVFNPATLSAGNYTLYYSYADSTGCTGYDTTVATVLAPPVANFHANPIYGQAPLTVNLADASTGAINWWQWTVGDTILYGSSPTVTLVDTGYHTITLAITDSLTGCSDTFSRQAYIMVLPNGIFEMKESTFPVKVYPSPADNTCYLVVEDIQGLRFRLFLYNMQGNLLRTEDFSGQSPYTIQREGLPAGVYLFELVSHKGHKASGKIIFR